MDVESYCENVSLELTGWKGKIYDIMRKLGKISSGDKGKILGNINDLHVLVEEIEDRIERLRNQCPSDWSPDKIELETKLTKISDICQDCSDDISSSYG